MNRLQSVVGAALGQFTVTARPTVPNTVSIATVQGTQVYPYSDRSRFTQGCTGTVTQQPIGRAGTVVTCCPKTKLSLCVSKIFTSDGTEV